MLDNYALDMLLLIGLVCWQVWSTDLSRRADAGSEGADKRGRKDDVPGEASRNAQGRQDCPSGMAAAPELEVPGLQRVMEWDPSFDKELFIAQAREVYEQIVVAFARGDRQSLAPLLSADLYDALTHFIDERELRRERSEIQFVSIGKPEIVDAIVRAEGSQIIVHFVSRVFTASYSAENAVISGSPKSIVALRDWWAFERILLGHPGWKLVATNKYHGDQEVICQ